MQLKDLKDYFERVENPAFYLRDVFSWRGAYAEVAFTPSRDGSKEESLNLIKRALNQSFDGYKGGDFTYNKYTEVHFEIYHRESSDLALYNLLIPDFENCC